MPKKMLIDATHPEETRVVVADGNKVEDFDFESINKRQLAGNIYLAKVTRVEPSLQAAFVEYGGNRHGFLAFPEIHPDYYQIPMADREALLAEEEREARADADAEEDEAERGAKRGRRGRKSKDGGRGDGGRGDGGRGPKAAKDTAKGDDEATADGSKDETAEGSKGGRRSRSRKSGRKSGRDEAGVGGLEVIDLEAAPAEAAEEPAAVPKGLEIADPGTETQAAKADADTAADDGPSNTSNDDDSSGGDGDDTPPRSMAEASGLEDETVTEDIAADGAETAPVEDKAPADGDAAAAPAEEAAQAAEDAPSETADAKPARGSRGRGGKSRRSRKSKDADEAAETAEAPDSPTDATAEASPDAGSDDDEIEQSGADDPREEIQARERSLRRRRYKIQDVIKVRQILLVQVVKEERGNKGAALTTYLSLAGRYCVLMPNTARGGGISRKITNATDRKRLREVVDGLDVPKGMGLIVRTAGAERTKPEIKRDYEFLLRQWEQVRELTLKSIAPCLIYEEGSLIKRSIRDIYSKDIDQVLVEGEAGYREAKDYMKMLTPSHAKNVQQYADTIPLFIRYQVESYLNGMFSPTVQLKSGGYIVIGITEALVAIDVNSGRSTKEGSVEDTALKTNLEAADEVARQLRLRDLAGLIVIDFIDMDENRNNRAVEKRMKERLKTDRARIQLGRISGFGLMEMSRQRLRPGMLEASTKPCPHCHGTGMIRSDDSLALAILREVEEEAVRGRIAEVTVTAPVDIANFMINVKRSHIARIEERHGITVQVRGDPGLINPDYKLDRVKGSVRDGDRGDRAERGDRNDRGDRHDRDAAASVVTASGTVMPPEEAEAPPTEARRSDRGSGEPGDGRDDGRSDARSDDGGKRRRRGKRGGRRRRGRGEDTETAAETNAEAGADASTEDAAPDAAPDAPAEAAEVPSEQKTETPEPAADAPAQPSTEDAPADASADAETEEKPKPARKPRAPRKSRAKPKADPAAETAAETPADKPAEVTTSDAPTAGNGAAPAEEAAQAAEDAPVADVAEVTEPAAEPVPAAEDDDKPKRRGWWSFGF